MNKIILGAIFQLSFIPFLFAGNENLPVGARSGAMANASVTLSDVWSAHQNQAGLAWLKNPEASIYSEMKYLNKATSLNAVAFAMPTKQGVFALSVNRFGYSQYNESKVGLAFAKTFGEKFSLGAQFDYLNTYVGDNNGSKSGITMEIGFQAKVTNALTIGGHLYNPTRTKLAAYNNERVPTIFKLGIQYTFSDNVLAVAEIEKDIYNKPLVKLGVEYRIIKSIYVRGGVSTNPVKSSFGVGAYYKSFKFDFSSSFHQQLGYSPAINISYVFNKTVAKITPASIN
jgi:hypothetical protein